MNTQIVEQIKQFQLPKEIALGALNLPGGDLDQIIEFFENIDTLFDNVHFSDVKTAYQKEDDIAEEEQEMEINEDGLTKQEIADLKWQKRQQQMLKKADEIALKVETAMQQTMVMLEDIATLTAVLSQLLSIQTYIAKLTELIEKEKEKLKKSPYYRYIQLKIEKIKLQIKKIIIQVEQKLNDIEVRVLQALANSKACAAVSAAFATIFAAIQVASEAVKYAKEMLNKILGLLPDMISVGACGMSFFLTPKSLQSVPMPMINLNQSIVNYLDQATELAIQTFNMQIDNIHAGEKGVHIATKIAESQVAGKIPTGRVNITALSLSAIIRKSIDLLVMFLPVAKPLPKYEKLSLINIGYMLFLATGWVRAGNCAFGDPLQLKGLMPQTVECTRK